METAWTVDGVELQYEVSGAGEPVVFIHGALIADTLRPLVAEPALQDRYRLICYHRRGYVASGRALGNGSVPEQAGDCRSLLRYLGVKRAHVVGHSYGGAVALQLALDCPDLIVSLVLLEPSLIVGASAADYRGSLALAVAYYRGGRAADVVNQILEARWPRR